MKGEVGDPGGGWRGSPTGPATHWLSDLWGLGVRSSNGSLNSIETRDPSLQGWLLYSRLSAAWYRIRVRPAKRRGTLDPSFKTPGLLTILWPLSGHWCDFRPSQLLNETAGWRRIAGHSSTEQFCGNSKNCYLHFVSKCPHPHHSPTPRTGCLPTSTSMKATVFWTNQKGKGITISWQKIVTK